MRGGRIETDASAIREPRARQASTVSRETAPVVAFLIGGHVLDDWLDELGLTFESFCAEMMGSWIFAYVQALEQQGVTSVLLCVSQRIRDPRRYTHAPTGTSVLALPAPRLYRMIDAAERGMRRRLTNRLGSGAAQPSFGMLPRMGRLACRALRLAADYMSTPLWRLTRAMSELHCTRLVIQEYEWPGFDICALWGRWCAWEVFGTFTGGYPQTWWRRALRRLALRQSAGLIICASTELERVAQTYGLSRSKLKLIRFPLALDVWNPEDRDTARQALNLPRDACVAMYHGSISYDHKGIDILLEAWEQVKQARPGSDLRLVLLGRGSDSQVLSEYLQGRPSSGVVWSNEWVHERTRIRRHLSAADVYVFPSRHDASPNALAEAMACGLPVVVTRFRGVDDVLPDGEASGGLIVPTGDATSLAIAIGRLVDDPTLRAHLAACSLRQAERSFPKDVIGRALCAALRIEGR